MLNGHGLPPGSASAATWMPGHDTAGFGRCRRVAGTVKKQSLHSREPVGYSLSNSPFAAVVGSRPQLEFSAVAKNLTIHDVPIAMIDRLRILARQRNESVEVFARKLLEAHLEKDSVHE